MVRQMDAVRFFSSPTSSSDVENEASDSFESDGEDVASSFDRMEASDDRRQQ